MELFLHVIVYLQNEAPDDDAVAGMPGTWKGSLLICYN